MGDRGRNRHGPKIEGLLCPFRENWDSVYYNVAWAEVYFRTKRRLHPSSHLATLDMGQKLGGVGVPFYLGVAGSTSNTMSRKPGLPPCQVASWFMQPFGHNRRGPKIGWGSAPFWVGVWVPSNTVAWAKAYLHTKWHLDASSRLATIKMGRKLGGSVPFFGEGSCVPI